MQLDEELKKIILDILENNGVIAFVTDTVWGLGCLPYREEAIQKIYEIKNREAKKPLILMSNEIENLKPYVKEVSPTAQGLIDKHFPGALTIVSPKSEKTPDYVTSNMDMVGIRIPNNEVFIEICKSVPGGVLATTSANLSNEPSAKTFAQAVENMGAKAEIVIEDFGYEAKGLESTVVAVVEDEMKILRQGAIEL